jgi:hypothetical protein
MKTPINELIEWIKDFDNRNLTVSRFDLDLKMNELLEKEKQVIIDAYTACWGNDGGNEYHKEPEAEQYYNETFKP